jgi:hypothetical protein
MVLGMMLGFLTMPGMMLGVLMMLGMVPEGLMMLGTMLGLLGTAGQHTDEQNVGGAGHAVRSENAVLGAGHAVQQQDAAAHNVADSGAGNAA